MANDQLLVEASYAGTNANFWWIPATFEMDTIRKRAVNVIDGIKKQMTISNVDVTYPLVPRNVDPTPGIGVFTVDKKVILPLDIMMYWRFNPRDFEVHWQAENLSTTLLARELPPTPANYMIQIALRRGFEQLELGIWQGSTAFAGHVDETDPRYQLQYFDGFIKLFVNDATVNFVASPLALTNANVWQAMQGLINITPKALLANPNRYTRLKFLCSVLTEQLYFQQLSTGTTYKNQDYTEKGISRFAGYDVVSVAGMPEDTIVFCEAVPDATGNLVVGMNSTEDNNIILKPRNNESELWFFKALMKYAVQYAFSNQTQVYTTLTTASFNP